MLISRFICGFSASTKAGNGLTPPIRVSGMRSRIELKNVYALALMEYTLIMSATREQPTNTTALSILQAFAKK